MLVLPIVAALAVSTQQLEAVHETHTKQLEPWHIKQASPTCCDHLGSPVVVCLSCEAGLVRLMPFFDVFRPESWLEQHFVEQDFREEPQRSAQTSSRDATRGGPRPTPTKKGLEPLAELSFADGEQRPVGALRIGLLLRH